MDTAKSLFDSGDLSGAINAALDLVRAKPTDIQARTFLFELSCFSGDWDRADKQLDVIGHQDAVAAIGSLMYRQCLAVEKNRERLFTEGLMPEFMVAPPPHVMALITAINRIREGNTDEARQILDEAEEERPAFLCKVNGEDAEDFRDYNDITSSVIEAIIRDSYTWVPIEQITRIEFFEPKKLPDLFWRRAKLETVNGIDGEVFIPALYVNSHKHPEDEVRLGRMTDWRDAGSEIYVGEGLKLFWYNGKDHPILELREIEFVHE
jgi:type VI secretion system protein ImpE